VRGFGGDGAKRRRQPNGDPIMPKKLTDTQLVLLSAAAQRNDGAIDIAENPKRGSVKKAIGKLLTEGLVEEVPAGGLLPIWRPDDDRGPLALCISARGLAAIGVKRRRVAGSATSFREERGGW
jgi:hypothetical protein